MPNLLTHLLEPALLAALAIGLAHPTTMHAQAAPQTAAPLEFDAASVKMAADQRILMTRPKLSTGRLRWTTTLSYLLQYAYHLERWRISGDTSGLGSNIYEIEATADPKAADDQVRLMLRSLLIDRFKMSAHQVTKDVEGYALTVAKNGPKMQEGKEGETPALPAWTGRSANPATMEGLVVATMPLRGVGAITGRRVTMLQFTETLQRLLNTAVFDQTGLGGKYYFGFEYATGDDPDVPFQDLFSTVKDLGLRLEKHKGPVEMLVVDHIEKIPTEN